MSSCVYLLRALMSRVARGEILERVEDAVGARVHVRGRDVAPVDRAVTVDHEEGPLARPLARVVDAVRARYLTLGLEVCEEREVQVSGVGERAVTPRPVDGDSHDLRAEPMEFREH